MPWWFGIISLIIEIVKLLLSLRRKQECPELDAEFARIKAEYKQTRDRKILEDFRDRLRQRAERRS